jgi:hypothetical protein
MNRYVKTFGFSIALLLSVPLAQPLKAQTSSIPSHGTLTPDKVRWILDCCAGDMLAQLGATRNDLKVAYDSGKLTISATVKPNFVLYDVNFGGITLCVIENI